MTMRWRQAGGPHLIWAVLAAILASAPPAVAVEIGDRAPDFTLPSTEGREVSLSEFRDKQLVLIEFHINDFGAT